LDCCESRQDREHLKKGKMNDYIPYATQDISEEDLAAVCEALRSDWLTQGPAVPQFECAFAQLHGVSHAVAVSNATAGLHIACLALGIGPGKRVWTSPNSFVASANCALYCGAEIDFVDIDPVTRNMSVVALAEKLAIAAGIGELPDLLIPVHFSGLPCDLREMRRLADQYDFSILADASHATGARYLGEPVGGSWADASVFSFHAVKIVTTAEGGMVTTQDAALARRLQLLRTHGITRDPAELQCDAPGAWYYEQQSLGFNYRMTDLQAALGLSQLTRLGAMQAARTELADRYDHLLAELPIVLPTRLESRVSAWHLYVVELNAKCCKASRESVFSSMRDAGIGVNVHYIPIHLQPYYAALGFAPGAYPAAERYYQQALSLPLFPSMTLVQQERVVKALRVAIDC
jgi:UDP-4-amino-4,6-dideoxy-N-acetyl-beta-L-altrosamine transaminase